MANQMVTSHVLVQLFLVDVTDVAKFAERMASMTAVVEVTSLIMTSQLIAKVALALPRKQIQIAQA